MISKIKSYLLSSLKRQLIFYIIIGVLCPLLIVMTGLFALNRNRMKQQAVENVGQKVELVSKQIEQMLYNIHSVSDHNAYNETFEEFTSTYYGENLMKKRGEIQLILRMFANSDLLSMNIRMGAVLNKYQELLNFQDPMVDDEEIVNRFLAMDVYNRENFSKIIWHPVQENFLVERSTGDPRQDKVVIGTRRIVNLYSGAVNAVHIFAIPEEEIWIRYKDTISDYQGGDSGTVFIIDPDGGIISSTDIGFLENGVLSPRLLEILASHTEDSFEIDYEGEHRLMYITGITNADWQIVAMIPVSTLTGTIDTLFIEIIISIVACTILCFVIILYFSKSFLAPIAVLKNSMQEVNGGNLNVYVDITGDGEIQEMGHYYNSMLRQINQFIESRVETEKKKKQLELEVIMGQVNPHFLYNTLENIVWKSSEAGCPDIGRIAASLGRMYRLSVNSGKIVVRIQQEIEHLMSYINIQKVRYQERVEFDLLVDYGEIRNFMTIKLILQPAVENCFMYALEDIDHALKIWVRVKAFNNLVRFEIIDNGTGMAKEQLQAVRKMIREGNGSLEEESSMIHKKGTGIGLHSISERIKLYFEKSEAVTIHSKSGRGTVVTVTIPLITSENMVHLPKD